MRYPVTATGSKEDVEQSWYVAQGFGNPTTYGFHEGLDWNLKTGGDTDLGQELKSIASGRIVYYHYGSHPTTNFGRHLVIKIDGGWGTRWVHYAHCLDTGFLNASQDVPEGKVVAYLGKSGTPYAHLHFAIFKVDPATIGGIDKIAKTQEDLNNFWEDPITFIDKWMQPTEILPVITLQTKIPQIIDEQNNPMEVQAIISKLNDQKNLINEQKTKLDKIKEILG